jgi:hypothetical protein
MEAVGKKHSVDLTLLIGILLLEMNIKRQKN